jgi:hypothetical protein
MPFMMPSASKQNVSERLSHRAWKKPIYSLGRAFAPAGREESPKKEVQFRPSHTRGVWISPRLEMQAKPQSAAYLAVIDKSCLRMSTNGVSMAASNG